MEKIAEEDDNEENDQDRSVILQSGILASASNSASNFALDQLEVVGYVEVVEPNREDSFRFNSSLRSVSLPTLDISILSSSHRSYVTNKVVGLAKAQASRWHRRSLCQQ